MPRCHSVKPDDECLITDHESLITISFSPVLGEGVERDEALASG
jgi:hypothetical protein